jgi:uncharacterized repeat protein (TIGR03803 family)
MSNRKPRPGRFAKRLGPALAVVLVLVTTTTYSVEAQTYTEKVLYSFTGAPDGALPSADLILDANGNLYGTAVSGGIENCWGDYPGCGIVFKVAANGVETVLYTFLGPPDGAYPYSVLVRDQKGNLYGTTSAGGDVSTNCPEGCGTVFKVDPTGKETILHSFTGTGDDGAYPGSGLRRDKKGNLYGTTATGGNSTNCERGCGTVFKIDPTGTETVVYSFADGLDGAGPSSRLIGDGTGNLYGTASGSMYGYGMVFKLDTTYTETVLYSFNGGVDGWDPSDLILDAAGNFYSTTTYGGTYNHGTVFKIDPTGKETVLHSFRRKTRWNTGRLPGLVRDKAGNLYSTTNIGGSVNLGTVFKVSSTGKETVLHSFYGNNYQGGDGAYPAAGLVQDGQGNFYGTTLQGGDRFEGAVFKLSPDFDGK